MRECMQKTKHKRTYIDENNDVYLLLTNCTFLLLLKKKRKILLSITQFRYCVHFLSYRMR